MIRSAVVYSSQTGNTRKVADAIAGALPGSVTAMSLDDAILDDTDVVFVGMPIIRFGAPDEARAFLQNRCQGRHVALFITHAAPESVPEVEPWLATCREAALGCDLVGFFHCQGQLAAPVKDYLLASGTPELVRFAEMSGDANGQPDESRLDAARRFAEDVAADLAKRAPAQAR